MNGWIKLHRKLTEWEWFHDHNTFRVFVYLLLTANHEEETWRGVTIGPGQKLTGRKALARKVGLSEQEIRTALQHLISTNDVTIKSTTKYSLITIRNWERYQQGNQQPNQQSTNNPTTNKKIRNKEEKKHYGEFGNVLLSEVEHANLLTKLGPTVVGVMVTELDEYIQSLGRDKYKDHSATIQAWARRKINEHAVKVRSKSNALAVIN